MRHHPGDEPGTGELLQSSARTLRRRFVSLIGEHELTPAQARALRVVLMRDEPPRLSLVAERLRVAPRSATEVVDALEQRGLVERTPDPDDRRATRVRATDEGRAMGTVMGRARERAADEYLARLSDTDRVALHRILSALEEQP